MALSKQMFRAAMLVACSSAPLSLSASDDPSSAASETQNLAVVVAVDGDDATETSEAADNPSSKKQASKKETSSEKATADAAQPRVWLGIGLKEVSGDLAAYLGRDEGVLVDSVFPDSPAAAAKLQLGDVIIAVDGDKIAGPTGLVDALRKLDDARGKQDVFPAVELKLLRRGKEIIVEVTPAARPESIDLPESDLVDQPAGQARDSQKLLKELERGGQVFRFGTPSTFPGLHRAGPERRHVGNFVVVIKDADGRATEVRIEREADKPAKITVKEGDKTREITEAEIDQLPAKIGKLVADALKQLDRQQEASKQYERGAAAAAEGEAKRRERIVEAQKNIAQGQKNAAEARKDEARKNLEKKLHGDARLQEHLHGLGSGTRIIVVGPEGPIDLNQSVEEAAAKLRSLGEEMAARGAKTVQELVSMPEQLRQLSAQVEELKKLTAELQEQLKAQKK